MNEIVDAFGWIADSEHWSGPDGIPARIWEHLQLFGVSLVLAAVIAIPVGLAIGHTRRGRWLAVQVANVGRSIPSLAILAIMFLVFLEVAPRLAFGFGPTVVALTLLGIPVILINTYVGVQGVDPDGVEAARGMGMNGWQVLMDLEVPLATPLIMTGLRLAAVQIVATVGIAALVAGGALGRYIVDGFYQREFPKLVAGVILIAALTLLTDAVFALLTRALSPRTRSRSKRFRSNA